MNTAHSQRIRHPFHAWQTVCVANDQLLFLERNDRDQIDRYILISKPEYGDGYVTGDAERIFYQADCSSLEDALLFAAETMCRGDLLPEYETDEAEGTEEGKWHEQE